MFTDARGHEITTSSHAAAEACNVAKGITALDS